MLMVLLLISGCGGGEGKKTPIPFDQVPEKLLKAAQERLPDVKFDKAQKKPNGDYEIIGKNAKGQVKEVEITPAGEITGIE
jgi:hypothetical protein